jgi:uncharacterized protein (TIGR00730 family)
MQRVCVFCGSAAGHRPEYRDAAAALGRALAARGLGLVYGGGAVGLMGVVAEAAMAAGAEVIGIIPAGLLRREVGLRSVPDLRVVETMHERKALMAELSDGFLALPGGYGTLEEAVETLTWLQLGIHGKGIVFLDTLGYWARLLAVFDQMAGEGFLSAQNRALALRAETPEAALDALAAFRPPPVPRWLGEDET